MIEIASESDPGLDNREKLPRYREAGIEEIWLVDPFQKNVRVEVRTGTGYTARIVSTGWIESAAVRGFRIDASWLWQEELPSELACLRQIM